MSAMPREALLVPIIAQVSDFVSKEMLGGWMDRRSCRPGRSRTTRSTGT